MIDLQKDYMFWRRDPDIFTFCRYPFIMTCEIKSKIFEVEAHIQMADQVRRTVFSQFLSGQASPPPPPPRLRNHCPLTRPLQAPMPHLHLVVRRDYLMEDTMKQISGIALLLLLLSLPCCVCACVCLLSVFCRSALVRSQAAADGQVCGRRRYTHASAFPLRCFDLR